MTVFEYLDFFARSYGFSARKRRERIEEVIEFAEGDSVHTESSYKYTVEGFQQLARDAGWQPQAVWIDAQKRFSMHLLRGGEGH
jgi:uncharacterized SAM-dependent methyltransferase